MRGYRHAFRKAFPYTIPVMTGYLFIGIAFGVMYAEKGIIFVGHADEPSGVRRLGTISGSEFFRAGYFFCPGHFYDADGECKTYFLWDIPAGKISFHGEEAMVHDIRLTDETYSLLCTTKVPPDVEEEKFLFAISIMDQSYWVIGSVIGSLAGTLIPFSSEGIDFAMTALFVVIFVEQWMDKKNRVPEVTGVAAAFVCLQIFGADSFVLPSMLLIVLVLFVGRTRLEGEEAKVCR